MMSMWNKSCKMWLIYGLHPYGYINCHTDLYIYPQNLKPIIENSF